jgi:hypothetical protein
MEMTNDSSIASRQKYLETILKTFIEDPYIVNKTQLSMFYVNALFLSKFVYVPGLPVDYIESADGNVDAPYKRAEWRHLLASTALLTQHSDLNTEDTFTRYLDNHFSDYNVAEAKLSQFYKNLYRRMVTTKTFHFLGEGAKLPRDTTMSEFLLALTIPLQANTETKTTFKSLKNYNHQLEMPFMWPYVDASSTTRSTRNVYRLYVPSWTVASKFRALHSYYTEPADRDAPVHLNLVTCNAVFSKVMPLVFTCMIQILVIIKHHPRVEWHIFDENSFSILYNGNNHAYVAVNNLDGAVVKDVKYDLKMITVQKAIDGFFAGLGLDRAAKYKTADYYTRPLNVPVYSTDATPDAYLRCGLALEGTLMILQIQSFLRVFLYVANMYLTPEEENTWSDIILTALFLKTREKNAIIDTLPADRKTNKRRLTVLLTRVSDDLIGIVERRFYLNYYLVAKPSFATMFFAGLRNVFAGRDLTTNAAMFYRKYAQPLSSAEEKKIGIVEMMNLISPFFSAAPDFLLPPMRRDYFVTHPPNVYRPLPSSGAKSWYSPDTDTENWDTVHYMLANNPHTHVMDMQPVRLQPNTMAHLVARVDLLSKRRNYMPIAGYSYPDDATAIITELPDGSDSSASGSSGGATRVKDVVGPQRRPLLSDIDHMYPTDTSQKKLFAKFLAEFMRVDPANAPSPHQDLPDLARRVSDDDEDAGGSRRAEKRPRRYS